MLNTIKERFKRLSICDDLYKVTADTGYANEDNMQFLHEEGIDAYIPDNQFRSRDPKFVDQKKKYGKRNQRMKKKDNQRYTPSDFIFDSPLKSCECPAGKVMWVKREGEDKHGNEKLFFEGKVTDCRACEQ